ncbi:MAG: alpha/beta hydrolase [Thermoleophilaceae bacterium]|nr:alpha/beta hydrolase [Thermoleophilaceae bacterium]
MSEVERSDILFGAGSDACAAWLYGPADAGEAPLPCVVMAHGFGALRDAGLDAYAERFAAARYRVLLFDYRHFGASGGEPRQLLDIHRQHVDWQAAVEYARSRPDVDPDRIVLWGTSFSGGHVIRTAARDPRIAAVIAQVPFTDGLATLAAGDPRTALKLAAAGLRDVLGALLGRGPHTVAIVGPPGSVAAMTTPDAEPGYMRLVPPGSAFRNEVAARIALRVGWYRPLRDAPKVSCPLLVLVGDHDAVTPPGPAIEVARSAPKGELVRYPIGHFDIYVGEWFERAISDQLAFLERHVSAESAAAAPAA